ncbi:MAG: putative biopolymer transport protein [Planctomycetaceae bacterium]|nr:putative biopolymer transport protein [Planctomycetaceae bacterium]
MSSDFAPEFQAPRSPDAAEGWAAALFKSPIIWGTLATVAFYALIPAMPIDRAIMQRYFCSHWILYATTWLFAMGMAILFFKTLCLPRENASLRYNLIRNRGLDAEPNWELRLDMLRRGVNNLPKRVRRSVLAQRYDDVCEYLGARHNGDTLEDHLKYLHDVAGERLHDSYALLRTLIWAIPILGFLGTVIGITMAIANITPDQLEQSMSEVTGGLAVAFDTTALSLTLSMILVFVSFVVERGEQQVLGKVESMGMRDIAPLFHVGSATVTSSPFEMAELHAAELLMAKTEKLINWQTDLWQQSLDGLRTRWEQVVQKQQTEFSRTLQSGMEATLNRHNEELGAARESLSSGFSSLSENLIKFSTDMQQQSSLQHAETAEKMSGVWEDVLNELRVSRDEQAQQTERLMQSISNEVLEWQTTLKEATHSGAGQARELHSQGQTLLKIMGEEAELTRLQRTLADNLDAIHAVETFEKALHSLTAAVHMLTIRNRAA